MTRRARAIVRFFNSSAAVMVTVFNIQFSIFNMQSAGIPSVSEHFGCEGLDEGAMAPGVGRESGLEADLFQEGFAVPAVLGGDLRQQQTAAGAVGDDQAVASDFNLL